MRRFQKLLEDTITGQSDAVATALNEIRGEPYAPQFSSNEQSVRAIIRYAYLVTAGQHIQMVEMPGRKGITDVAFIPAPPSGLPAMIVELKWNRTAGSAISQIKEKQYAAKLKTYEGKLLPVGINYDEKTGRHSRQIEWACCEHVPPSQFHFRIDGNTHTDKP